MPDTSTEVALATTTLGANAATITLSSIPSTYTDLKVVLTGTIANGSGNSIYLRFNNSATNTYSATRVYGDGFGAYSSRYTSGADTRQYVAEYIYSVPYLISINVFSYAGSTNKSTLIESSFDDSGGNGKAERTVGLWQNTSAIDTITFSLNGSVAKFASGTTATLYGIL